MNDRSGIIVFAVVLGFILLPIFMLISGYIVELIMPHGQDFVLYKAIIGLLYAGYLFVVRKFTIKFTPKKIQTKSDE